MTELLPGSPGPDELRRLNQTWPERYPFLLQSTAQGENLGRYDILFAFPGDSLVLEASGDLEGPTAQQHDRFLSALDAWWEAEKISDSSSTLPFHGGWFLYLGYELAGEVEPSLELHNDPLLPIAFAVRCPAAIIYDHIESRCHLVTESGDDEMQQILADLEALPATSDIDYSGRLSISEDDGEQFTSAVRRAKEHIEAGDVYQANLSRQWTVQLDAAHSSESLYASLCEANPGPFAGIARWQGTSIISSSPERLLEVRSGQISTRPIAGTRRRGSDEVDDDNLSTELFAHPKERAEHIMLIDLERNDLGRVSLPGTVEVDEMMVLESYAHVHHIVSNVRGRLRPDITPGSAVSAVFPGGTITGCPKVRCMEIINELEHAARGAYTGSFGYLNRDGSLDLNILIRTMVKRDDKLYFRAGAGIVADSDPQAELDETRAKAEGMLRALQNG